VQSAAPRSSDLIYLLSSLTFENYGVVQSTYNYFYGTVYVGYFETLNVTTPYTSWAYDPFGPSPYYLFQDVNGAQVTPPSGMRSSVPLGGETSHPLLSPPCYIVVCFNLF
jgi:hypothetical protein